jgi:xylulokinase
MGGFDQACTALGAGNVRAGVVSESTGTSLALVATVEGPPAAAATTVACHLHVVPGRYFLNAHHPAAGSLVEWFRDELAPDVSLDELDRLAGSAAAGSDGVVVLPYVSGTATPAFDPHARGVIFGLTLRHERRHLARAFLEGVAFALADLVDEARRVGVEPGELRAVGGGARSDVWSQIKADVTALPVQTTMTGEHAGALGAAILAAVGSDLVPSVEEAADALVQLSRRFEPDAELVAAYAAVRRIYRELYPRLRELFAA